VKAFDSRTNIIVLQRQLCSGKSSFNGIGGEGYTDQLFRNDTLGGSTLVANINVVGGSSSDILTAGHVLFA